MRKRLLWYGQTREDKRGRECHTYGHIPHEKEATVVWTDTGRQERQRVSHLQTYIPHEKEATVV